jgi:hypothetical protein
MVTEYHIKAADGALAKGTLLYTSSKPSNANTKLFLDSSFRGVNHDFITTNIRQSNVFINCEGYFNFTPQSKSPFVVKRVIVIKVIRGFTMPLVII